MEAIANQFTLGTPPALFVLLFLIIRDVFCKKMSLFTGRRRHISQSASHMRSKEILNTSHQWHLKENARFLLKRSTNEESLVTMKKTSPITVTSVTQIWCDSKIFCATNVCWAAFLILCSGIVWIELYIMWILLMALIIFTRNVVPIPCLPYMHAHENR